jgi:hypothetical protein
MKPNEGEDMISLEVAEARRMSGNEHVEETFRALLDSFIRISRPPKPEVFEGTITAEPEGWE